MIAASGPKGVSVVKMVLAPFSKGLIQNFQVVLSLHSSPSLEIVTNLVE